jgi:hypothetical protein
VPFLWNVTLGRRDETNDPNRVQIISINVRRQVHLHPADYLAH